MSDAEKLQAVGVSPQVGDEVRVTLTGTLTGYDAAAGIWTLKGSAPGHQHWPWTWEFHWATEFEQVEEPADT
jgi:hypothetical protein